CPFPGARFAEASIDGSGALRHDWGPNPDWASMPKTSLPAEVSMAISFECEGCGKSFTVSDHLAGKTGQCKQCGFLMAIPSKSDADVYGPDEAHSQAASLPPRMPAQSPAPARPPLFDPAGRGSKAKKGSFSFGSGEKRGVVTVVIVVVLLVVRVY